MSNLTSNGQVTSRDIRQGAVKTLHVVDDAITTPKIPDLAITFPDKIDDPIWVETQQVKRGDNLSVSTTRQVAVAVSIETPAWVNNLSLFCMGEFQLTNTSGAETLMSAILMHDASSFNGSSHECLDAQTQVMVVPGTLFLSGVAASTVDIDLEVVVSAGTHTSNNQSLNILAIGRR